MSNTGGPAFPGATYEGPFAGMTLRDYFAAKAMQALLSWPQESNITTAQYAYIVADAMLAAREQK